MNQTKENKTNPKFVKVAFVLAAIICLSSFVSGPITLVGGFLFLYFIGHPFQHLNHKAVNWLLKIAVVGLGFGMNIPRNANGWERWFGAYCNFYFFYFNYRF